MWASWTSAASGPRCAASRRPNRAGAAVVSRAYTGFNVRHFHQIVRREHRVRMSYSFLKQALQTAGLVKKHRARGRHRRRREPRACFGEMLHLNGSVHAWLTLAPDQRPCLILVSDDATKRVLAATFFPAESTRAVMTSLGTVLRAEGLPMALYTYRAHWAFHTPTAKGPVDKAHLTHVSRALARLGIEHIPSYSPQARGRSERLNRTFQDRLVNELRVARITTLEAANRYLAETFVPQHNATFSCALRDPASAFVPLGPVDLETILCHEEARVVARDNTVCLERQVLHRRPARAPQLRGAAGDRPAALGRPLHDLSRDAAARPVPRRRPADGPSGRPAPEARAPRGVDSAPAAVATAPTRRSLKSGQSLVKPKRTNHLSTTRLPGRSSSARSRKRRRCRSAPR